MNRPDLVNTIIEELRAGYLKAKRTGNDMTLAIYVTGLKLFHSYRLGSDDEGYKAAEADIAKLNASLSAN